VSNIKTKIIVFVLAQLVPWLRRKMGRREQSFLAGNWGQPMKGLR
jgi:hypothetical protein